jgi:hypothetical protein
MALISGEHIRPRVEADMASCFALERFGEEQARQEGRSVKPESLSSPIRRPLHPVALRQARAHSTIRLPLTLLTTDNREYNTNNIDHSSFIYASVAAACAADDFVGYIP